MMNLKDIKFIFGGDLFINDEIHDNGAGRHLNSIEKLSDNEFRIVEIKNIANINEKELNIKQTLTKIYIGNSINDRFIKPIDSEITAKVIFDNKDAKILAKQELENGSTLYIEEVSNSKFENYCLARIVSLPHTIAETYDNANEFMIEDPQFAICDQDDKIINYDYNRLEDYYERVLDDGTDQKNIHCTC